MADDKTIDMLNGVLADATVFYYKLHNYHWNVTGPGFYTLHDVFEDLYKEWSGILDELAERVKSLGGDPLPTLAKCVEVSGIKEETERDLDANTMVQRTLNDIHAQRERMKAVQERAQEVNDKTTENILDDFVDASAKHVWMLSAFLGKRADQD